MAPTVVTLNVRLLPSLTLAAAGVIIGEASSVNTVEAFVPSACTNNSVLASLINGIVDEVKFAV